MELSEAGLRANREYWMALAIKHEDGYAGCKVRYLEAYKHISNLASGLNKEESWYREQDQAKL